jgi:hypothetical protein
MLSCCKRPGLVLELLLVGLMACSESTPAEPEPASCCANCAHHDYCVRCPGLDERCGRFHPEGDGCTGLEGDDLCQCLLGYENIEGGECHVENGMVVLIRAAEGCLIGLSSRAFSKNACNDVPRVQPIVSEHPESDLP